MAGRYDRRLPCVCAFWRQNSLAQSIRRVELDEDAHLLASDAAAPRRAPETPTAAGAAAVVVSDMGGEINAVLRGLLASHQDEALVQLLQRTPPDIVQGITPDTWLKLVPLALQQWMAIPETVQPSPLRSMAYLICAHLAHNLPQLWGRPELQGAAAQVRRQCVELQRRGVALEVTTLSGDEIAALIQALAKWAW